MHVQEIIKSLKKINEIDDPKRVKSEINHLLNKIMSPSIHKVMSGRYYYFYNVRWVNGKRKILGKALGKIKSSHYDNNPLIKKTINQQVKDKNSEILEDFLLPIKEK